MNELATPRDAANRPVMEAILQKIKAYHRILIFRHRRLDGDCMGASRGLREILRATFPDKEVLIIDDEHSAYLSFVGPDDDPIADEAYADALAIVVDVGDRERISNPKFALCREIIKIDHHIEVDRYGDLNWVEDDRAAACEMIAAFYRAFADELTLTPRAAEYLYMGLVTDSGRFRFEGVTGDTLRLGAMLLDTGIDTEKLYAHLYLKEFDTLKFKAHMYKQMQLTPNGVAYLYVSTATQAEFGLSFEEACTCVSYMDSIKGCLCWLAFIETGDEAGSIRVRLRSRFTTVNELAEHFHGNGHACASGATVYSADEVRALINEADERVREYKATHEGWL